mmetsp:Transcript_28086/g.78759  ORF Transcript_28086/g.78759 Transcript_28086/m.78759 type:complete len:336 (+) Transcript_28086:72-1079(+)
MTINIYPDIVRQDDLSPDQGFGSDIDDLCQQIQDATKGWGANKDKTIEALATQDATRRHQISLRYKELFQEDLRDLMKKEFSGDLGNALQFLACPADEAECRMLKKAMDGIGAQANVIFAIMCGRTNEEMERIKRVYFRLYTKDLGKRLAGELHGDMERLIFNCLQACEEEFDPQFHTPEKAVEDAEEIHKKGQGKFFGTDERGIYKILCAAPPKHIEAINQAYADKYGYTLMKALEKELGGNAQKASIHMIGMKLKPFPTIAKLIKSACAGIGTDELLLTTCVVRYQEVMKDVMAAHIEEYGKSVHDRVREECGGKYKTVLLAALNAVWPEQVE